jgi:hypothetical protein
MQKKIQNFIFPGKENYRAGTWSERAWQIDASHGKLQQPSSG